MHFKQHIGLKYAELVYFGLWFTPLREALDAFVENTQQDITGTTTLSLYKGNVSVVSRHPRIRSIAPISRLSPWTKATTRKMRKDLFAFWVCRRVRGLAFAPMQRSPR